jgi:uncharacterized protein YkwD
MPRFDRDAAHISGCVVLRLAGFAACGGVALRFGTRRCAGIPGGRPHLRAMSNPLHFPAGAVLACAAAFVLPALPAIAGTAPADPLAGLVNAYRAAPTDCGGRAAVPALVPEPALAQVHIGPGTFLESALRNLGYRAAQAEAISLTGPPDAHAAMAVLQQKYCAKLLGTEFSAIGSARTGNAWQLVLAQPLVFPDLPDWEAAGQQVLEGVNRARAQARTCGTQAFAPAPPVAWNGRLALAALGHSGNLAEGHYFSHKERDGSDPADRATRAGYAWRLVGENIASGNRSAQEAVQAWLDSPGHCANIMNPGFTEMGAAYAIDPANEHRTPYWTQVFGRPR